MCCTFFKNQYECHGRFRPGNWGKGESDRIGELCRGMWVPSLYLVYLYCGNSRSQGDHLVQRIEITGIAILRGMGVRYSKSVDVVMNVVLMSC